MLKILLILLAATQAFAGGIISFPGGSSELSFINSATSGSTSTSTLTIAKPENTAQYDFMVATLALDSASDLINSVPTGWTELYDTQLGERAHRQYAYWKVAEASEGDDYSWGLSEADEICGGIITIRSSIGQPSIGNYAVSTANASETSAVAPSITIQKTGNWVIGVASSRYGTTWDPPGGSPTFSERFDYRTAASDTATSITAATAEFASTGASSDKTFTATDADYWKAAQIEVQRP